MTESSLYPTQCNVSAEQRDRLFFDKWEFAFAFRHPLISFIRNLPGEAEFWKIVHWRKQSSYYYREVTDDKIDSLLIILRFLQNEAEPFKFISSYGYATIYSNDPTFAARLCAVSALLVPRYNKQAVVAMPRDTVILKEPKHKLRSYFKAQWFPEDKREVLLDFFTAQNNEIAPCGAFKSFLRTKPRMGVDRHWLPSYYYVDYDDPRYETMLGLMMPRCFRKTMPIVKRINN